MGLHDYKSADLPSWGSGSTFFMHAYTDRQACNIWFILRNHNHITTRFDFTPSFRILQCIRTHPIVLILCAFVLVL